MRNFKHTMGAGGISPSIPAMGLGSVCLSYRIITKVEIIRTMAGLGVFKHHAVTVVGLVAYHCMGRLNPQQAGMVPLT